MLEASKTVTSSIKIKHFSIVRCNAFVTKESIISWTCVQLQALGQSKENFVIAAQSKSKNAWAASQAAAFLAFKSGLLADEALFDAQKIRTLVASRTCRVLMHCVASLLTINHCFDVGVLCCQPAGNQWCVGRFASLLANLGCWACWGD